nr:hypothetical protein [Halonatronomonas betaini]
MASLNIKITADTSSIGPIKATPSIEKTKVISLTTGWSRRSYSCQ